MRCNGRGRMVLRLYEFPNALMASARLIKYRNLSELLTCLIVAKLNSSAPHSDQQNGRASRRVRLTVADRVVLRYVQRPPCLNLGFFLEATDCLSDMPHNECTVMSFV